MQLPILVGFTLISAAQAAPSASGNARLYARCVVCHQPSAWGSQDGAIPNLAGQQKRYLETQLDLFASGARVDTAMQVVTAHPKTAEHSNFAALAAYLSALQWNPTPVTG
jgi:cytochrome c553